MANLRYLYASCCKKTYYTVVQADNVCYLIQPALCTGAMPTSIELRQQILMELDGRSYGRKLLLFSPALHFMPATSTIQTGAHRTMNMLLTYFCGV